MPVKKFRPVTPSLRFKTVLIPPELTEKPPEKGLLLPLKKSGGRNNRGRVTIRHRGGGHKRKYRIIDFLRDKDGIEARVIALEYDPNRSAHIALLQYKDGEKRYILAPEGLKIGDVVKSGEGVEVKPGNTLPLKEIPEGTVIHNLELTEGKGAALVRSAGAGAQLLAKEGNYAQVRLPSGEIRMIRLSCKATVGQVGNTDWSSISWGKAGRKRWLGIRPTVRGVAMNPIDHPMGGGEGKSSGGRHPTTPWGKLTKGYKTRKKNKPSNKYILKRRGSK